MHLSFHPRYNAKQEQREVFKFNDHVQRISLHLLPHSQLLNVVVMTLFLGKIKRPTSRFLKSKFFRLPTTLLTTISTQSVRFHDTNMARRKRVAADSPAAEAFSRRR
jgi:hypothetical protein